MALKILSFTNSVTKELICQLVRLLGNKIIKTGYEMNIRLRRAIGITTTITFIIVYVVFASIAGNLFLDKPIWIKIPFFAVAGIIWIFPLKPLYMWMKPKPGELPEEEKPPTASIIKRGKK